MPIIGIMRNLPEQHIETIAKKYCESGLTCLEITMNSTDAATHIASLAESYGGKLNIGAGTVCSMADLEVALRSNAQFIVTPVINEEVIKACVNEKVPIFPGAYTPSEIYRAWALGATMIKLFPAGDLKPNYIKEVLAPLDFVSLVPTGGITIDNFTGILAQGAKGVGIGSGLFPRDVIQREDWNALSQIFSRFAEKYHAYLKV
jgi:2-dehydro-3-deoxyphosphogluconate aldolase/(4S)-4-hydroxy-2-oxoglutarate aldolase